MILNCFISAAVRKVIIVIVLVTIVTIIPSLKVIVMFFIKGHSVRSDILLWRAQWLPSIGLNEADCGVLNTLQLILILERYGILRVLMVVTRMKVREVLIIMS